MSVIKTFYFFRIKFFLNFSSSEGPELGVNRIRERGVVSRIAPRRWKGYLSFTVRAGRTKEEGEEGSRKTGVRLDLSVSTPVSLVGPAIRRTPGPVSSEDRRWDPKEPQINDHQNTKTSTTSYTSTFVE